MKKTVDTLRQQSLEAVHTHTHTHTHTSSFSEKGITLIALIITIVVLIVLSGVTISLVLENNGIIEKTQEAKNQTVQAQNKEIEAIQNLENHMNEKIEGIVSTDYIANSTDKNEFYGKTVTGYTCTNSAACNWKIFYAGSDFSTDGKNHIYLIADDYIARNYIPNSSAGNALNVGKYAKTAYFTDILNDYTGSESITDARIKKLNNSYFSLGQSSTNNNMKSVAYMCDTNTWNVYKGEKADYAIGGPTVEMLMKSYSQKHGVNYGAKASSINGYQISDDANGSWKDAIGKMLKTSDPLYVIKSTINAYTYWLASPGIDSNCVMIVRYNGDVSYVYYNDGYCGFRPLVCLSSDVKLQDLGNGIFAIK